MTSQEKSILKFYVSASIIASVILGVVILAQAETITDDMAVQCIMGEARNQGSIGMQAVGEAIRNRGHLKGVYGCKATFSEPKWVWDKARKAWKDSEHSNLVKGADHWHNVVREGETYWTVKMTKTVCIKDHCFYK